MTGSKSVSEPPRPEAALRLGRVRIAGAVAALLAALLLLLAGQGSGRAVFDRYQRWWPNPQAGSRTELVLIDADSVRELGPWPWPRNILARLTQEIADRGAVAIGFDMVFPDPDRLNAPAIPSLYPELSPAAKAELGALHTLDGDFAEALGDTPSVLAWVGVDEDSVDYQLARERAAFDLPVEAEFARPLPARVLGFDRALTNIPDIEEFAEAKGLINGPPDPDGIVRSVPLVVRIKHARGEEAVNNIAAPGFALELARTALKAKRIEPVVAGDAMRAIRLGDRLLPVTPEGALLLHLGHYAVQRATSASDLVKVERNGRPIGEDRFRGKVVIVGLTAAGTADTVSTPLDPQTWGVFVQAQAVDAILAGRALSRPAWAFPLEWVLGALLAGIAILWFPRLGTVAGVLVPAAILVLVTGVSTLAFVGAGLLIDPLRPLGIGAAAAAAVLVALFFEGNAVQRMLRLALDRQRIAAARAEGEMEAARDIQRGMLPPREQLRDLDPRFDLDAAIEPARRVGGDFYDAIRLTDGRLCFLVADVTDKGVSAALFMALSKALSKSVLLRGGDGLAAMVDRINEEVSRDNSQNMFVTMLIGIADPATGAVELCNAGHEDPLVVRRDGTIERIALDGGPPLCVAAGFPYSVESLTLAPGDALVVVTDGVTEAQAKGGGFFGHVRMVNALTGWTGPAGEAAERLIAAVRAFEAGREPSDDVTILAIKYRG